MGMGKGYFPLRPPNNARNARLLEAAYRAIIMPSWRTKLMLCITGKSIGTWLLPVCCADETAKEQSSGLKSSKLEEARDVDSHLQIRFLPQSTANGRITRGSFHGPVHLLNRLYRSSTFHPVISSAPEARKCRARPRMIEHRIDLQPTHRAATSDRYFHHVRVTSELHPRAMCVKNVRPFPRPTAVIFDGSAVFSRKSDHGED